jgi:hypothetical protein
VGAFLFAPLKKIIYTAVVKRTFGEERVGGMAGELLTGAVSPQSTRMESFQS